MTKGKAQQDEHRLLAPVAGQLHRGALLSVLAGGIWPMQAGLLAWIVAGWAAGQATGWAEPAQALALAAGFLGLSLLRAGLAHRAGGLLFQAADTVIGARREALLRREARDRSATASAATAALIVQKLAMLRPWITRHRVAQWRVMVLPPLYLALALWFSWAVALILLLAGPLIPVFMTLIGIAAEAASRRHLDEIGSLNAMLMDRLAAALDIRLLGAAQRAGNDFATRADSLRVRTMAVLRIAFLSSTVLELFAMFGIAFVAVFVGFTLLGVLNFGTWGAPLTLGQGVFLLLITPEYFQPLRDLAAAWHDRAAGRAVLDELAAQELAPRQVMLGQGVRAAPLAGAMRVKTKGAQVALPAGGILALPDLVLHTGEAVAVAGPSGAGKSTLLAAIAGLLPLCAGKIHVCGQVLDAGTADAWRARLALVPQRVHFADHTLAEFLDPHGQSADPWPALELAQAGRVVRALPEGLATRLGETGGGVSGGEARRLLIARAVLAGGDLLLADEPTADLDAETAAQVIHALLTLRNQGYTLLVASHDPRLNAAMDRIIEVAPCAP